MNFQKKLVSDKVFDLKNKIEMNLIITQDFKV